MYDSPVFTRIDTKYSKTNGHNFSIKTLTSRKILSGGVNQLRVWGSAVRKFIIKKR